MTRGICGAVWALTTIWLAAPVMAGFGGDTVCTGQMDFANPDGSSVRYQLTVDFTPSGYRIVSTNIRDGAVTTDVGTCTTYLQDGCRHGIAGENKTTGDFYDFKLRAMSDTDFAYSEIWKDGAEGGTVLTCRAR